MRFKLYLTCLGIFALGATYFSIGDEPVAGVLAEESAEEYLTSVPGSAWRGRGDMVAYIDFSSPPFKQTYSYGNQVDSTDLTRLVLHNHTNPHVDEIPDESFEFAASFDILYARAKTRDHYYIGGRAESGDDVLERWKKATTGMPGGGGSYIMKRKELYRGTALNGIRSIGVDPLGRYLLVVHDDDIGRLSQVALPGGGAPVELYNEGEIPHLAMSPVKVFPRKHSTEGVVWTLQGFYLQAPSDRMILHDFEDDGVIDSWMTLGYEDYMAAYGAKPGVWTDWFIED